MDVWNVPGTSYVWTLTITTCALASASFCKLKGTDFVYTYTYLTKRIQDIAFTFFLKLLHLYIHRLIWEIKDLNTLLLLNFPGLKMFNRRSLQKNVNDLNFFLDFTSEWNDKQCSHRFLNKIELTPLYRPMCIINFKWKYKHRGFLKNGSLSYLGKKG